MNDAGEVWSTGGASWPKVDVDMMDSSEHMINYSPTANHKCVSIIYNVGNY